MQGWGGVCRRHAGRDASQTQLCGGTTAGGPDHPCDPSKGWAFLA